jgi:antitoxin ParD1/3/4
MRNGDAIKLPENLRTWAQAQAVVGGFDNVDEYVSHVLRDERKRLAKEALDALDSGPATPMTDADWEEMMELARKGPQKPKRKRHASKH